MRGRLRAVLSVSGWRSRSRAQIKSQEVDKLQDFSMIPVKASRPRIGSWGRCMAPEGCAGLLPIPRSSREHDSVAHLQTSRVYDLTGFEWCADQHHPRVHASQNSDEACEDEQLSGGPLVGRLPCKRSRPPWCRSGYHRYASDWLETAMRSACAVIRASAHVAP